MHIDVFLFGTRRNFAVMAVSWTKVRNSVSQRHQILWVCGCCEHEDGAETVRKRGSWKVWSVVYMYVCAVLYVRACSERRRWTKWKLCGWFRQSDGVDVRLQGLVPGTQQGNHTQHIQTLLCFSQNVATFSFLCGFSTQPPLSAGSIFSMFGTINAWSFHTAHSKVLRCLQNDECFFEQKVVC